MLEVHVAFVCQLATTSFLRLRSAIHDQSLGNPKVVNELHHVLRVFILGSERAEGVKALSISEQCSTSLFPNTGDIGKQLIRTDLGIDGWELQPAFRSRLALRGRVKELVHGHRMCDQFAIRIWKCLAVRARPRRASAF